MSNVKQVHFVVWYTRLSDYTSNKANMYAYLSKVGTLGTLAYWDFFDLPGNF